VAWEQAFLKNIPEHLKSSLLLLLNQKISRRQIATLYQLDYAEVERDYRQELEINRNVLQFILHLKIAGHRLLLISNAKRYKVNLDLEKLELSELFDKIYTSEDGRKPDSRYIQNIMDEQNLNLLIMVGNSEQEDVFSHPNVISLLIQDIQSKHDLENHIMTGG